MIITLTISDLTAKQADDVAEELIVYLRDELGILIDDYTVEWL